MREKLKEWWYSLDSWITSIVIAMCVISLITVSTASPAVASKIGLEPFFFIKRQAVHLLMGICIMFAISFLPTPAIRRFSIIGFLIVLGMLCLVLFFGHEIKGARRWLSIGSFSLQPSELAKTFFAVYTAWILSIRYTEKDFPSFTVSFISYLILIGLLILQPDFGMAMTVSLIWIGQLFISGLSVVWMLMVALTGIVGLAGAYILLPHVRHRIDIFLNPQGFENYQVTKSLEAFKHGGFYGVGPGEGVVKKHIPDSHTDFIFSVIGEEMGFIACMAIIALFAIFILRGLYIILYNQKSNFTMLAVSGILIQIGIQSVFNIGVTLHMFPTKGMTLPLISYGGSSVISISVAIGVLLALTRKHSKVQQHYKMRGNA